MIEDTSVLKKLATIKEVPTLPEVMQEVMEALSSEESSADDLATILARDQASCSKVLKIANSAYFAQSRRIYDISDAIVILGFDSIAHLVLTTAVLQVFGFANRHGRFDVYGFWKHSIATAMGCKTVAELIGNTEDLRMLHTAGLLHDIGKLVLVGYFPDRYDAVCEQQKNGDIYLHEAELSVLGFTHCDVGEWLGKRWNFPDQLVRAIAEHHAPACIKDQMPRGSRIVNLADTLCNHLKIGNSGNRKPFSLDVLECSGLGLDVGKIRRIYTRIKDSAQQVDSLLKALS